VGRPLLQAALKGEQACLDWLASFELELRTAVFLAGIKTGADLKRVPVVITGRSKAWLDQLGYRRVISASSRARSS
jgi:isopentenyl diphosphate isomerase/L-lactate dehydrogenase-like FMN-dependent dehydrogenase